MQFFKLGKMYVFFFSGWPPKRVGFWELFPRQLPALVNSGSVNTRKVTDDEDSGTGEGTEPTGYS